MPKTTERTTAGETAKKVETKTKKEAVKASKEVVEKKNKPKQISQEKMNKLIELGFEIVTMTGTQQEKIMRKAVLGGDLKLFKEMLGTCGGTGPYDTWYDLSPKGLALSYEICSFDEAPLQWNMQTCFEHAHIWFTNVK
jgi:hypothetical protein